MISVGLADDDALVRSTLTELLATPDDIRVVWTACDGQETLALLRSPEAPEIQVLLLDVQMPRLDGMTLAEMLHRERPDIAILILTTFVADGVLNRALAAGVRGFIAKEDRVETLADTIRNVAAGNTVLSPASSAIIGGWSAPTTPATTSPRRLGGPAAGRHPVPAGVRGAGPHGRGAVQPADRHPAAPERDDRQDARLRDHRQARRPGPGRRGRLRPTQWTCLTFLRSDETIGGCAPLAARA